MFAIVWALCGLLVIAILTGKITTALTDYKYWETNLRIYGAEVSNKRCFTGDNESVFVLGIRFGLIVSLFCTKPGLTSKIAAIANNSDFRLGVLKSARMNTGKSLSCPDRLVYLKYRLNLLS